MAGIDRLVSKSLSNIIKKEIDSSDLKRLERKLFFDHGMSIKFSVEYFDKFTKVLKNILAMDTRKFEGDCVNKVIKVKKSDQVYLVKIIDSELIDLIIGECGDAETRKILTCLFNNELTIPQILKESRIPKTTGYRKIENLILNGLILESGKVLSESKKISKYRCVFDGIVIEIGIKKNSVKGIIDKKIFEKSSCVKGLI